jgi:diguanylate cyclase (GGDEF)-like protein/PAS domain S-box-containing protein
LGDFLRPALETDSQDKDRLMTTWMGAGTSDGHRDALMIAVALALFAVVTVLLVIADSPADGIGFLYVLPVGLVAVDLGWRWGLGAAALCFASYVLWTALGDADLSVFGYATRALVLFGLGGTLGWVAARARAEGDESERWFAMANVMLATASLDGTFTRLNPAWEATLGWTREELMSKPYVEFIHPDDVEPTFAAAGVLLEGSSHVVDFENRYATKDGGLRWLLWSSYSDGRQVYAVTQDITDQKRLQAEREELLERVEAMARTDVLTGLPNRRAWDEELRREMGRAGRHEHVLAVVMLDLDRFKDFNDAHGHQAGDRLLGDVGRLWRMRLRVSDFVARYGGEEFAALLPACAPDEAIAAVERLRLAIPDGQTCSAGVAYWDTEESPEALIGRADAALYEAKRAGRDRVVTAT